MNRQSTLLGLKKNEYLSNSRTLMTQNESPGQDRKSYLNSSSKQNNILGKLDKEFKLATISMQQI